MQEGSGSRSSCRHRRCRRTTEFLLLSLFLLLSVVWIRCELASAQTTTTTIPTATTTAEAAAQASSSLDTAAAAAAATTGSTPLLIFKNQSGSRPSVLGSDASSMMIDDDLAKCRMEDLELANDAQLYEILQEMKQTAFFRNFVVDLQHKCPLAGWSSTTSSSSGSHSNKQDSSGKNAGATLNQGSCSNQGSCGITKEEEKDKSIPEEAECSGGDVGADLDDEAEPLCTVQPGTTTSLFGGTTTTSSSPTTMFDSNALTYLQSTGFQSQSQREAFAWKDETDAIFTEVAEKKKKQTKSAEVMIQDMDDEIAALRPDVFWKDMCSSIGQGDGSATVNLALNPERNTGYNGTHIWRAIYEENCSVDHRSSSSSSSSNNNNNDGMCLEERVLYRLLSGLHTSTTVAIANNYYPPSKKKGRATWMPNAAYFMQKFASHPEHIRNLHFSYVVMLRALGKASPFLYQYADSMIQKGAPATNGDADAEDDVTAAKLLRRLLDSSILQSCHVVFGAFDESLMFQEDLHTVASAEDVIAIQRNFKGVFHNVSSILDCVQCQQCKLHGKLAMLGYGAALKVLFMSSSTPPVLDRNEIVALINTVVKLSESVKHVQELTTLYWYEQEQLTKQQQATPELASPDTVSSRERLPLQQIASNGAVSSSTATTSTTTTTSSYAAMDLVDAAVGAIAELGRSNRITFAREQELVQLALQQHPELLILAKHYGSNLDKFLSMSIHIKPTGAVSTVVVTPEDPIPDAIIVGSGLAGMAAALNVLDRGGRILMMEKEHLLGGNSNKASSGINACCPDGNVTDSLEIFMNDTIRSAGNAARQVLISTLVSKSAEAVEWLRTRVGVDLSLKSQLGGHSSKRTHRPSNGMAGAEIIYGIQKAVKAYVKTGMATILTDTKVTKLLTSDDGSVVGVECINVKEKDSTPFEHRATNVVLATGGFASDRSNGSYLDKYRPELLKMPTTAGAFSTGDGVTLATQLGAATVDMDKVQVHPTGWVDPADPNSTSKILAAELMRGVGGLLINNKGERFCNELGTRSYVTNKMLSHDPGFAKTGNWSLDSPVPIFSLVLSASAAANSKKHVDLYTHKGILSRLEGVSELAQWMGLSKSVVVATLKEYQREASKGRDKFGKTTFDGVPANDLEKEVFYAGKVTPVLHYCMGGITIDVEGNVLNANGEIIPGLHAAGEVTGGVHGVNRLAGNSLLECTVYGTIVGKKLPIRKLTPTDPSINTPDDAKSSNTPTRRKVLKAELEQHNTPDDCWVAVHGVVYDFTSFADEHPAGPQSIHDLAGTDGTEAFSAVHNQGMLDDFTDEIVGSYAG